MRPGTMRPSNFAAMQAAQRMHRQRPVVLVGPPRIAFYLNAEQVKNLVEPLDAQPRTELLQVGREIAPMVDAERPLEQQLVDLREHLEGRFDTLASALERVEDVAIETLRSLAQANQRAAKVVQQDEVRTDDPNGKVALVVLLVCALLTGFGIGDPGMQNDMAALVALIALTFSVRKDL